MEMADGPAPAINSPPRAHAVSPLAGDAAKQTTLYTIGFAAASSSSTIILAGDGPVSLAHACGKLWPGSRLCVETTPGGLTIGSNRKHRLHSTHGPFKAIFAMSMCVRLALETAYSVKDHRIYCPSDRAEAVLYPEGYLLVSVPRIPRAGCAPDVRVPLIMLTGGSSDRKTSTFCVSFSIMSVAHCYSSAVCSLPT